MKKILTAILLFSALTLGAQEKPVIYAVANAHLDTQWNWDIKTTIDEYLPNTLNQNFRLFEEFPGYIFNFEGADKYAMIKEYYPEQFERLRGYVQQGRWHVSGGAWDANDHNMPSIESCIRNYLYGQTFFKTEFGTKSSDVMLPDCFGFGYTLPTVASHCGLIGFGTQKLGWRKQAFYPDGRKYPFTFGIWEGIDGSRIMATLYGGGYTWNPKEDLREHQGWKDRLKTMTIPALYVYYGTRSSGLLVDRGGSPLPRSVELFQQAVDDPGSMNVVHATTDQMYKDFYMDPRLEVYKGELLMDVHATGCYTSHSELKNLNRRIEWLLGCTEAAAVIGENMGVYDYPAYTLDEVWKRTLLHQFHDDLTGTSIPAAYRFSYNDHYLSMNQLQGELQAEVLALASTLDTDVKGIPVAVFNPISAANSDLVEVSIPLADEYRSVAVYGPDGRRCRSQILSRSEGVATLVFTASDPSLGVSIYDLRPSRSGESASPFKTGERSIENRIYRVILDACGDICSIVDKRCGRELVKEGEAFGISLFTDNLSEEWPAWEIMKDVMDRKPLRINENVRVSVEYSGPVAAALRVERSLGGSRFVQKIRLTDGAQDDRIDICCEVDWNSRESLLKASFPVSFTAPEASYDLGLGNIRRGNNTPTQYEVYAHQWADMSAEDGSYGVTVMNRSKYGWDKPDDNTLRLTLLHTPKVTKAFSYQGTMDIGRHEFTYSVTGHGGALDAVAAGVASDILNQPKLAVVADRHNGASRSFSFLHSDNPAIRIKAVKKAQDGDGYIVRVYEQSGQQRAGGLCFADEIESAELVNGIEEPLGSATFIGKELDVVVPAFSLRSYRVRLKGVERRAQSRFEPLALPYNVVGITSDAFTAIGHVDRQWRSYAAEMLPSSLEVRGIPFSFGRTDYDNAVRCKGQMLSLPQGCTKVYLLAASADGPREAVFKAGADVRVTVGRFTDYYAYYGWEGHYGTLEGVGEVAYVGSHRHHAGKFNESYEHTYMYLLEIPVADADCLILPSDENIVVLSSTAVID